MTFKDLSGLPELLKFAFSSCNKRKAYHIVLYMYTASPSLLISSLEFNPTKEVSIYKAGLVIHTKRSVSSKWIYAVVKSNLCCQKRWFCIKQSIIFSSKCNTGHSAEWKVKQIVQFQKFLWNALISEWRLTNVSADVSVVDLATVIVIHLVLEVCPQYGTCLIAEPVVRTRIAPDREDAWKWLQRQLTATDHVSYLLEFCNRLLFAYQTLHSRRLNTVSLHASSLPVFRSCVLFRNFRSVPAKWLLLLLTLQYFILLTYLRRF